MCILMGWIASVIDLEACMKTGYARHLTLALLSVLVGGNISCSSCSGGGDPETQTSPPPAQMNAASFNFVTDAFVFSNFGTTDPSQGLTDAGLVRMFGADVVCIPGSDPCEITPVADGWRGRANVMMEQGRSEGFAVLSTLFASGHLDPNDFGAERVSDLRIEQNTLLKQELAYWSATQLVPSALKEDQRVAPKDAVAFLAKVFGEDSERHYRLAIAQRTASGFQRGHALTPFGYFKGEGDTYWLRVYDNNFPQQEQRIELDVVANTWRYEFTGLDGEPIVYESTGESDNWLYFSPVETRLGVLKAPFAEGSETFSLIYSGMTVVSPNENGEETGIQGGAILEAEGESVMPSFAKCPLCGSPVGIINQTMINNGMTSRIHKITATDSVTTSTDEEKRSVTGVGDGSMATVFLDSDNFDDEVSFGEDGEVTYKADKNDGMTVFAMNGTQFVSVTIDGSDGDETSVTVTVKPAGPDGEVEVEVEGLPEGKTISIKTGDYESDDQNESTVTVTSGGKDKSTVTIKPDGNVESENIGKVIGAHCSNGVLDTEFGETDVDCGGAQCGACKDGNTCTQASDCVGECTDGTCSSSACQDGVKGGGETDIDCGGDQCMACVATNRFDSPACLVNEDCDTNRCEDNRCIKLSPVVLSANRVDTMRDYYTMYVTVSLDGTHKTMRLVDMMQQVGEAYQYELIDAGYCWSPDYGPGKRTGITDANDTEPRGVIRLDCPEDGKNTIELKRKDAFVLRASDPAKVGLRVDGGAEQVIDISGDLPVDLGDYTVASQVTARLISSPVQKDYTDPTSTNQSLMGGLGCTLTRRSESYNSTLEFHLTCQWGDFTCYDGVHNQNESDVDCGGLCGACTLGGSCNSDTDCSTENCVNNVCERRETCVNATKDADEADVDCGGVCLAKCTMGQQCTDSSDCADNSPCSGGVCGAPRCSNGMKDDDETDVDCGGVCPVKCVQDQGCQMDSDCASGATCTNNICTVGTCDNAIKDGDEGDVDCGGACSIKCMNLQSCNMDTDCEGALGCYTNVCAMSACENGVIDGDESSADCGGSCPDRCGDGQSCNQSSDCDSANNMLCVNSVCTLDPCMNGVQDGTETDVDCGGGSCAARCISGQGCGMDSDCTGANILCLANTCTQDPCTNGIQDANEAGVDCGGTSSCGACAGGASCTLDSDCGTGDCECGINSGNCSGSTGNCGAGQLFVDQPVTDGTSSSATYTIPAGCTSLFVQAWGAAGGAVDMMGFPGAVGGAGGYVQGTLTVAPGDQVTVWLGEGGGSGVLSSSRGSYLGSDASGGTRGFGAFGSDPGDGGGLTSIQITGSATQVFSVPAGAGASDFSDPSSISVSTFSGGGAASYAGDTGNNDEGGGGAGDQGGSSQQPGAYGMLPAGLTAYDSEEDMITFEYVPAGTGNADYARCLGVDSLPAGAGDMALGKGGDGCVVLRCVAP